MTATRERNTRPLAGGFEAHGADCGRLKKEWDLEDGWDGWGLLLLSNAECLMPNASLPECLLPEHPMNDYLMWIGAACVLIAMIGCVVVLEIDLTTSARRVVLMRVLLACVALAAAGIGAVLVVMWNRTGGGAW